MLVHLGAKIVFFFNKMDRGQKILYLDNGQSGHSKRDIFHLNRRWYGKKYYFC